MLEMHAALHSPEPASDSANKPASPLNMAGSVQKVGYLLQKSKNWDSTVNTFGKAGSLKSVLSRHLFDPSKALANCNRCCVTAENLTAAADQIQGNRNGFARGQGLWQPHFECASAWPFGNGVERIGCNLIAAYSDRWA